jgi:hypothetical protein
MMQPIYNACRLQQTLNRRRAIDGIRSRNHHFSSGHKGGDVGGERRRLDEKSASTLDRLLDYSRGEMVLAPTLELHEASRNNVAFDDQYSLFVTHEVDETVECAPFRAPILAM